MSELNILRIAMLFKIAQLKMMGAEYSTRAEVEKGDFFSLRYNTLVQLMCSTDHIEGLLSIKYAGTLVNDFTSFEKGNNMLYTVEPDVINNKHDGLLVNNFTNSGNLLELS
jgi:hypothetical protein